jgi:hypothetical protein
MRGRRVSHSTLPGHGHAARSPHAGAGASRLRSQGPCFSTSHSRLYLNSEQRQAEQLLLQCLDEPLAHPPLLSGSRTKAGLDSMPEKDELALVICYDILLVSRTPPVTGRLAPEQVFHGNRGTGRAAQGQIFS